MVNITIFIDGHIFHPLKRTIFHWLKGIIFYWLRVEFSINWRVQFYSYKLSFDIFKEYNFLLIEKFHFTNYILFYFLLKSRPTISYRQSSIIWLVIRVCLNFIFCNGYSFLLIEEYYFFWMKNIFLWITNYYFIFVKGFNFLFIGECYFLLIKNTFLLDRDYNFIFVKGAISYLFKNVIFVWWRIHF